MATFKERIANGKCGRCGVNSITPPVKQCSVCLVKLKGLAKKDRQSKRGQGLCLGCKQPTEKSYCEVCRNKIKQWESDHKEQRVEYARKHREKLRNAVLDAYGNKCVCCGEECPYFLTIDHINNDGASHRKAIGGSDRLCRWLVKNSFPEGFQLLCWNCNSGKYLLGKCPHQLERKDE